MNGLARLWGDRLRRGTAPLARAAACLCIDVRGTSRLTPNWG